MSRLVVTQVADAGDYSKERVVLKATTATDIGRFAIFRTVTMENGLVSTSVHDVFWFPDKMVAANDLVVLYTKPGATTSQPQASGSTNHFYYWGKLASMWAKGNKFDLVLVETSDWKMFPR